MKRIAAALAALGMLACGHAQAATTVYSYTGTVGSDNYGDTQALADNDGGQTLFYFEGGPPWDCCGFNPTINPGHFTVTLTAPGAITSADSTANFDQEVVDYLHLPDGVYVSADDGQYYVVEPGSISGNTYKFSLYISPPGAVSGYAYIGTYNAEFPYTDIYTTSLMSVSMDALWDGYQPGDTYTVVMQSVPEPSTWSLMIVGFGLIGLGLRRRPAAKASLS